MLRRILHHVVARGAFHTVLIWVVVDDRMLVAKVIPWRRRRNTPLERGSIPRVLQRGLAPETAVKQIEKKNQLGAAGSERGNGDELMQWHQRAHKIVDETGVAANIPNQAEIVEGHEDAIGAD